MYFPYKKSCTLIALLCTLCFTGAILFVTQESVTPSEVFGKRSFVAQVVSVERELTSTKILIKDSVYIKKIQVTLYNQSSVLPGDTVKVSGIIEEPQDFVTDTGRLFEYRNYLKSKHIVAVGRNVEIELLQKGGWSITRSATIARQWIVERLATYVSFPFDGIAAGMVFGYQGGIPKGIEELFRTTGVLHTLVLSGYNITLLGGFLGLLLQRIPQRVRIGLTFVAISFLILMSGAGVASIRAGVMGSIGLLSILTLRQYNAIRALSVSYLLFFVWSPSSVFIDPGFHLSFLATFCMISVVPKIEKMFYFIPKTPYINIRELVTLAVVLPVFILPYTMYFSGVAPLSSFVANIVLGVVTPIIMIVTPLVIAFSWFAPLASLIGMILATLLDVTVQLLKMFDRLPKYNTPELTSWSVVGIYCVVIIFLFKKELKVFIERLRSSLLLQTNSFE